MNRGWIINERKLLIVLMVLYVSTNYYGTNQYRRNNSTNQYRRYNSTN